jgi:hypothetical protein
VPVEVNVTGCVVDVFRFTVPKAMLAVLTVRIGVVVVPVPVAAVLIVAEPVVVPSCVDVAVQVPEPGTVGVKTPAWVMVPPVAVQFTVVL